MKRVLSLFFILLFVTMLSSCSKSVSGTYQKEGDSEVYMELKSDGSFFSKGHEGAVAGKYTVEGTTLTITLSNGMAGRFKIESGKITDDKNGVLVKK